MIPAGYEPLKHADQKDFSESYEKFVAIGTNKNENIAIVVNPETKTYTLATKEFKSIIYYANRWDPLLLDGVLKYFAVNKEFLTGSETALCKIKQLIKESKAKNKPQLKERCKELLQTAYLLPAEKINDREQVEAQTHAKVGELAASNTQLCKDYDEVQESVKAEKDLALEDAHSNLEASKEDIRMRNRQQIATLKEEFETKTKAALETKIAELKAEKKRLYEQLDKEADTILVTQHLPILTYHQLLSLPKTTPRALTEDEKNSYAYRDLISTHARLQYINDSLFEFSVLAIQDYLHYVMLGTVDYENKSASHCADLYAIASIYKNTQLQAELLKVIRSKLEINEAIELLHSKEFPKRFKFDGAHPLVKTCLDKIAENSHLLDDQQVDQLPEMAPEYFHALLEYNNLKIKEIDLFFIEQCFSNMPPDRYGKTAYDKIRKELYYSSHDHLHKSDQVDVQMGAMANRYTASLKSEMSSKEVACEMKEGFDISKKHEIALALSPTDLFKRKSFTLNHSFTLQEKDPSSNRLISFTVSLGIDFEKSDELSDQFKFRFNISGHNYQAFHSSFKILIPSQVTKGKESTSPFYGCAATYSHEALANQCVSLLNNRYIDTNGEKSDYLPVKIEFQLNIKKK